MGGIFMRYQEEKEYLQMLPEGTQISTNIFERGFYFDGNSIKYRTSIWQAITPYIVPAMIIFEPFFFILIIYLLMIEFFWGAFIFFLFFVGLFWDSILAMYYYSLDPKSGFDIDKGIVWEDFPLNIKKIPFEDASCLSIIKIIKFYQRKYRRRGIHVFLESNAELIEIAMFHPWEECHIESFVKSVKFILKKEFTIREESDVSE
jgi:hypothetical protein